MSTLGRKYGQVTGGGSAHSMLCAWRNARTLPKPASLLVLSEVLELPLENVATAAGVPADELVRLAFVTRGRGHLSELIRRAVREAGSTTLLAQKWGLSTSVLSHLSGGSRMPSIKQLTDLADGLGDQRKCDV